MSDAIVGEVLTLSSVLRDTAVAWKRFLALVDSAPRHRVEEQGVCGDWSLKTLVGHVGFWDGFEADRLSKGGPIEEVDFQPINEQNAIESSARPFAELRAELDSNHGRLLAGVSRTPSIDPKYVRWLMHDHYAEHELEIENWSAKA